MHIPPGHLNFDQHGGYKMETVSTMCWQNFLQLRKSLGKSVIRGIVL